MYVHIWWLSRSKISWGRSRRRDMAKSNMHYVITCQECDRGGKCACPTYLEQSRPILSRTTSLRQVYDTTYEYLLESLNFFAFMKPNKHKMRLKGFFHNLTRFVFEYFCDSRRILATFAKFCLNSLFATWSYRFTRHPARAHAQAPLHLPHKFFDVKSFYKILPFSQLLSPNLAKTLLVFAPNMLFSCRDWATS